jgi:hypothetical protein
VRLGVGVKHLHDNTKNGPATMFDFEHVNYIRAQLRCPVYGYSAVPVLYMIIYPRSPPDFSCTVMSVVCRCCPYDFAFESILPAQGLILIRASSTNTIIQTDMQLKQVRWYCTVK